MLEVKVKGEQGHGLVEYAIMLVLLGVVLLVVLALFAMCFSGEVIEGLQVLVELVELVK